MDPAKVARAREQLLGSSSAGDPKRWGPAEVAESGKPLSDFIPVGEAEAQAREQAARIREAARAIPGRIAEQVAAETDPAKVKALLEQEIDRTLEELADVLRPGPSGAGIL